MRLLASAGLVDETVDFQPQRPRQRLRLLFCPLLLPTRRTEGVPSADHLAGVITLGDGRYKPLAADLDLQRTDTPTSCKSARSKRVPVLGYAQGLPIPNGSPP